MPPVEPESSSEVAGLGRPSRNGRGKEIKAGNGLCPDCVTRPYKYLKCAKCRAGRRALIAGTATCRCPHLLQILPMRSARGYEVRSWWPSS